VGTVREHARRSLTRSTLILPSGLAFVTSKDGEEQDRTTQEAALEGEGWRIVMRDEQYKTYLDG
jgi:hypothetical protein